MDEQSNDHCDQPAFVRYTWPGRDEAYACVIHSLQIQNVALDMGLRLQMIRLTIEEILMDKMCSQLHKIEVEEKKEQP